jgi:hypothetical protein
LLFHLGGGRVVRSEVEELLERSDGGLKVVGLLRGETE